MNSRISALEKLKKKEKFLREEWEYRGLNPSPKHLSDELEKSLNDLITDLISASNSKKSEQESGDITNTILRKLYQIN